MNMSASPGLWLWQHMIIRGLKERYVLAKDISSRRVLFVSRIELRPSDLTNPVKLCRRRFPKRMTFVMTINKAQKQTLKYGGMYSPISYLYNGQLYEVFFLTCSLANFNVTVIKGHWKRRKNNSFEYIKYLISISTGSVKSTWQFCKAVVSGTLGMGNLSLSVLLAKLKAF